MSLPNEQQVEKALNFLAETDEQFAVLKGRVKAEEYLLKHFKSKAMLLSNEKSVAARETAAVGSDSYVQQVRQYETAIVDHATMEARRQRAHLTIDVWRSLNANRRMV